MRLHAMNLAALTLALCAAAAPQARPAFAQGYPARPVHVIVPYAAGASGDLLARMIGAKLSETWGQQFIVENKAGAAGTIGAGYVAKAAPDGYTLLVGTDAQMAISPHIQKELPYDPNDFTPIIQAGMIEFVLTAHPSFGQYVAGSSSGISKLTPENTVTRHRASEVPRILRWNGSRTSRRSTLSTCPTAAVAS